MYNCILKKKIFTTKMTIKSKSTLRVRYAETDQMGVVHHSNYAKYIELARVDWLDQLGISYKNMEQNKIILPVVSLTIKYIKPAYFDDRLTVYTFLKQKPTVKMIFDYEIYNQNNELITIASTTLAFVNSDTKKPFNCPNYILKAFDDQIEVS